MSWRILDVTSTKYNEDSLNWYEFELSVMKSIEINDARIILIWFSRSYTYLKLHAPKLASLNTNFLIADVFLLLSVQNKIK